MLISNLDSENKCYVQWEAKEEYLPKDTNPVLGPFWWTQFAQESDAEREFYFTSVDSHWVIPSEELKKSYQT